MAIIRPLFQRAARLNSEVIAIQRELTELQTKFGKGHAKVTLAEQRLAIAESTFADNAERLQRLEDEEFARRYDALDEAMNGGGR